MQIVRTALAATSLLLSFCHAMPFTSSIAERMNSERTETILPGVHRDDYNLHQRYLTTFLKWSSFTRFPCSSCQPYHCRIPSLIHFNYGCILRFIHIQFHFLIAFALSYQLCVTGNYFSAKLPWISQIARRVL